MSDHQFIAGPGFTAVEHPFSCGSHMAQAVKMGRPEFWPAPIFPEGNQSGESVHYATIAKDGSVKDLVLVRSAGRDLDKAAFDAISQWRYKPHIHCGQPVEANTYIFVSRTIT
ncbi:MAG: energy transducer TonB [Terriglobales bacterium]